MKKKRTKIIAHGVKNLSEAEKALELGADFLEVDVAKMVIFPKFTIQHHGLLGKIGIGEKLTPLLESRFSNKLLCDLKHTIYSLRFIEKLSQIFTNLKVEKVRVTGVDWKDISNLCKKNNLFPFYSLSKPGDLAKIKKILPKLEKPQGFSVKQNLVNRQLIKDLRKLLARNGEIWVWPVNDKGQAKKLVKLGVEGMITDEVEKLAQFLKNS